MSNSVAPAPSRSAYGISPSLTRLRQLARIHPAIDVTAIQNHHEAIRRAGGDPAVYLDLLERKVLEQDRRSRIRYRRWCRRSPDG